MIREGSFLVSTISVELQKVQNALKYMEIKVNT